MEEKGVVFDLKKARRQAKWNDAKAKLKKAKDKTVDYLMDHPELMISLGIAVVSGTVALVKGGIRHAKVTNKLQLEKSLKELYVYDRSMGHYWKLRKPLSNNEWAIINNRVKSGERLADILLNMGVLD